VKLHNLSIRQLASEFNMNYRTLSCARFLRKIIYIRILLFQQ